MNSIVEKKIDDTKRIGIVYAAEWFGDNLLQIKYPLILPLDYVVCQWHDYHDGEKSNLEGLQTIAICREKEDAMFLYNSKISEKDICYVIFDELAKTFLDNSDFFTTKLRNAKTFSNSSDADSAMRYYIKIYKNTNRSDTTLFLEVIPIEMQFIIKS
jgi:hypothetical protein